MKLAKGMSTQVPRAQVGSNVRSIYCLTQGSCVCARISEV